MSEETTFRLLRRVPISCIHLEYRYRWREFELNPETFNKWLDENGWLEKEFYDTVSRYEKELIDRVWKSNQLVYYPTA